MNALFLNYVFVPFGPFLEDTKKFSQVVLQKTFSRKKNPMSETQMASPLKIAKLLIALMN